MTRGIDVSESNGTVNWAAVKSAGMAFAILRTGYGKKATDKQFKTNLAGVKAQGIPYGFYHYSYALTTSDAAAEAALVVSLIKGTSPACKVWFDMEDADGYKAKHGFTFSKANITAICKTFVTAIQAAGFACGVYASRSWFGTYIDTTSLNCPVWVADWGSTCQYTGHHECWQFSETYKVSGCSGSFDGDVWTGSDFVTVGKMQKDSTCAAGVPRYALSQCKVYKYPGGDQTVSTLGGGARVTYYGNYCMAGAEKWAYVRTAAGTQGYVLAANLGT